MEVGPNNYKMEVLTEWKNEKEKNEEEDEDDGEKDKKKKDQKDKIEKGEEKKQEEKDKMEKEGGKEEEEEEKVKVKREKAQFHQQESSPRLPCSGSSWCNILCAAQQQPNFLGDATNDNSAQKPPKSAQFNGAFQLDEASHIYENKACDLWITSYEFQSGPAVSNNTEFLLDQAFKPKQSSKNSGLPICGCGDRNTKNTKEDGKDETGKKQEDEGEEGGLLYVTEV